MTREQTLLQVADNLSYFNDCKFPFAVSECKKWINKIYDDFEEELKQVYREGIKDEARCNKEELKKAYVEGGNDVWKALNCKELAK